MSRLGCSVNEAYLNVAEVNSPGEQPTSGCFHFFDLDSHSVHSLVGHKSQKAAQKEFSKASVVPALRSSRFGVSPKLPIWLSYRLLASEFVKLRKSECKTASTFDLALAFGNEQIRDAWTFEHSVMSEYVMLRKSECVFPERLPRCSRSVTSKYVMLRKSKCVFPERWTLVIRVCSCANRLVSSPRERVPRTVRSHSFLPNA